jgi:hypothetical protein
MYLASMTRPDISFAVISLSRFMAAPRLSHWRALLHLLRYLAGTPNLGITFTGARKQREAKEAPKDNFELMPSGDDSTASYYNVLIAYSDADWGSELPRRRSRTGYVLYLNGGPVAWSSKLQPSPALSTTEAEFYAMCDTAKEVRRLQMVLGELGFPQPPRPYVKSVGEPGVKNTGTIMFEDNVSSMGVGKQDGFSSKTRHIDLRLQFIQDWVQRGYMSIVYCPTAWMIADILTKVPGPAVFNLLRPKLLGSWYQVA